MIMVIFDVDGVLADSLPPHRQFCLDMNMKYSCNLLIPEDVAANPMDNLLRKAGFEEEIIPTLLEEYQNFSDNYTVELFDGVHTMLNRMYNEGYTLSVVSSNLLKNINSVLGNLTNLMGGRIFGLDNSDGKVSAIMNLKREYKLKGVQMIYVGDMFKDYDVAEKCNVTFYASGYGWEIRPPTRSYPIAHSVYNLGQLFYHAH